MTAYSAVTAGEKDAESPLTVSLVSKLDLNPLAMAEYDDTSPDQPGRWKLIDETTVAAQTELDLVGMTTAYDTYMVEVVKCYHSSAQAIRGLVRRSVGSVWAGSTTYNADTDGKGAATGGDSGSTTHLDLSYTDNGPTSAAWAYSGLIYIHSPMDSAVSTQFSWNINYGVSGNFHGHDGQGTYRTAEALDGFRIYPAGGVNITGTARLWGLTN